MARRRRKNFLTQAFQRNLKTLTRTVVRVGNKALKRAVRAPVVRRKSKPVRSVPSTRANWSMGLALAPAGARRYHVYKPPGVRRSERLPLVVMLHGCGQDAQGFAASTGMNRLAARERFIVLYVEQDRLANAQACWNWFDTRNGRAQGEAAIILAAMDQVCLMQPVDCSRIALAGFSAGAGMAALLGTRYPARFKAVVMHSGITTGLAHSSATALSAMLGKAGRGAAQDRVPDSVHDADLPASSVSTSRPALLVIHGSKDHVVAPVNGLLAAERWAAAAGGRIGHARVVQRGLRYQANVTDWRVGKHVVATLCDVNGLGHAWSGGGASHAHSDPKGPDAARMIWAFAGRQFEAAKAAAIVIAKAAAAKNEKLLLMRANAQTRPGASAPLP